MNDPLQTFDWKELHLTYDKMCERRFKVESELLEGCEPRPPSDRELYYHLLKVAKAHRAKSHTFNIKDYQALLYWKMYSTGPKVYNDLRNKPEVRLNAEDSLDRLLQNLPTELMPDPKQVVDQVRSLDKFKLHGIKGKTTIPMRTTFLHFFYPEIVPIFDRMVLQAVGVCKKNANHNFEVFHEYLAHAWNLSKRYGTHFGDFKRESPVRLIDMALWVHDRSLSKNCRDVHSQKSGARSCKMPQIY